MIVFELENFEILFDIFPNFAKNFTPKNFRETKFYETTTPS